MKQKKSFLIFVLVLLNAQLPGFSQDYIFIWPDGEMPNSRGLELEWLEERERVTQVDQPGMHVYLTSKDENKHSAVLILPPGGYQKLTYNIAGIQLAKWFNSIGVNAFVLMYRLPNSPDLIERYKGPVQDAQRAMKIIHANAEKWGIDIAKIGVYGSSAGGHLASTLCTIQKDFALIGDTLDFHGFRPSFQILVSPVISMVDDYHQGSRDAFLGIDASDALALQFSNEFNVSDSTPPCFLVHAENDNAVSPLNSMKYYKALHDNQVPASLHIFPFGGHGIALRNNPGSTKQWTVLCEAWLIEMEFIK